MQTGKKKKNSVGCLLFLPNQERHVHILYARTLLFQATFHITSLNYSAGPWAYVQMRGNDEWSTKMS